MVEWQTLTMASEKKTCAHNRIFFWSLLLYINYEDGNGILAIHPAWERKKVARLESPSSLTGLEMADWILAGHDHWFQSFKKNLPKDLCVNTSHS